MRISPFQAGFTAHGKLKASPVHKSSTSNGLQRFKGNDKVLEKDTNSPSIARVVIVSAIGIPLITGGALLLAPVLPAVAMVAFTFLGCVGLVWALGVPQMKPDFPGSSPYEAAKEARRASGK